MNFNPLQLSIIKTLAYFDVFNFPLTAEELYRYLWQPQPGSGQDATSYEQFINFLPSCPSVSSRYGYFFLAGRAETVEARRRMAVPSAQKLKKARRAARLIRSVPFLKAIFICNSVAAEVAKPESDIDLFIITATNRIWLVRLFSNLILLLIGWRRRGLAVAHRLCLSFYIDSAHLGILPLAIDKNDVYLAYWFWQVMPLYDPENYYEYFIKANQWAAQLVPNAAPLIGGSSLVNGRQNRPRRSWWQRVWEVMWRGGYGDLVEREAKNLQLAKMKRASASSKPSNSAPSGVVVGEGVLKFHERDRRAEFRDAWLQKIKNFS